MVETVATRAANAAEAFARFASQAEEPAASEPRWLVERRALARERFERMGLPTRKDEAWRSTNVSPIVRASFSRARAPGAGEIAAATRRIGEPWEATLPRFVLVDGHPVASLARALDGKAANPRALADAARAGACRTEELLGLVAGEGSGPFVQLNGALFRDGVALHVSRGASLDRPLEIVHVATRSATPFALHSRTLLVLEEGARATIIERFIGLDGSKSWVNAVSEVVIGPGAELERIVIEEGSAESFHLATARVRIERDARLRNQTISLGAGLTREELHVELLGPGAECALDGLYVGTGQRHVECRTFVDHAQPHGTSTQNYRGILDGRARGAFGGSVLVRADAQKTSARQSNKNLLLSHDASADTKPELSILADDVVCSHGATVGELDEQEIFYLRSRGIDERTARALLVLGFARAVTAGIAREDLRRWVDSRAIGLFAGTIDLPADMEEGS
jgi:Fe-S cluster assembly protein SufD